jgi:hypothetical protein
MFYDIQVFSLVLIKYLEHDSWDYPDTYKNSDDMTYI